jgi:hypothetical protein
MDWLWIVVPALLGGALLAILLIRRWTAVSVPEARQRFLQQREHLEADHFLAASRSGKPRGLRWKGCEWESEVVFARECATGRLTALVSVTIAFEAIEGSDMEGLPAVGNLRQACAVFFLDRGRWRTAGKTVFNLTPVETIAHFQGQYQRLEA